MAIVEEQDVENVLAQSRGSESNTSDDGDIDEGEIDEREFDVLVQRLSEVRQEYGAAFPDCLALYKYGTKNREIVERAITVLKDQGNVLRGFEGRR